MKEEEYLLISGIQHFIFCERQWGLIHIENIWEENKLTAQGEIVHKNVDQPFFDESRGNLIVSRSMPIVSHTLEIYGIIDMVEFELTKNGGVYLNSKDNYYNIKPIEYKRGKPKSNLSDVMQLCAQTICLEEMFNTKIEFGYIYYGEIKHREKIVFTDEIRNQLVSIVSKMKGFIKSGITPKGKMLPHCVNCSIYNKCLPEVFDRKVSEYINKKLFNEKEKE